jgi:hypothetical protein
VYTERIHRLHMTSCDTLVWFLQERFIGYTGIVVIN